MSSPPLDPYKVLGVPRDAQLPEIRAAHRKLVLQCHPDKVKDPELKPKAQDDFQTVQRSYEMLSDDNQRAKVDDQLKLAELRKQYANKPNSSAPRSSPKMYAEFEVRTAEPRESRESRSSSYKSGPVPNVKVYSYSRSWEEGRSAPRYYEPELRPRREQTYSERPSKREAERERERDREREKAEKRRIRREKEAAEEQARIEKAEKAARKEKDRKAKEKQRSKEYKREKEEKRREREDAYIEPYDDEPSIHRKSSGKKYEEKRERSSHREPPVSRVVYEEPPNRIDLARAYISRSRTDSGPERSTSYHTRTPQPPAAPTPPPAGATAFPTPEDDDARRSSARPRRGSADVPPMPARERSYRKSSREPLDDPHIVNVSPASRNASRFATEEVSTSPPRGISRTNTMPTEKPSSRPMPVPRRAQTYSESKTEGGVEIGGNRGRYRTRMHSQVEEESESEEEYERHRRSKGRSSHKPRSSERHERQGTEYRYQVDGGRTKLQSAQSYSRKLPVDSDAYAYYGYEPSSSSPPRPLYTREPSYAGSSFKVKQSRNWAPTDIKYSHYEQPNYRDEYATAQA